MYTSSLTLRSGRALRYRLLSVKQKNPAVPWEDSAGNNGFRFAYLLRNYMKLYLCLRRKSVHFYTSPHDNFTDRFSASWRGLNPLGNGVVQ